MTAAPIFPAEPLIDAIVTHDRIPFDEPPDTASHIARGLGYIAGRYGGTYDRIPFEDTEPRCLPERTCPAMAVFIGGWVVMLAFCGACFAGVAWAVRRWVG